MKSNNTFISRHCEHGCNVSVPCGAMSCPRCGSSRGMTLAQKRRSEKEAQLEMAQMKKLHDKLLSLYHDGMDCNMECWGCPYNGIPYCDEHRVVDYMISHGVTINQKKQMYGTLRPKKGNRRYLCLLEDEVRL